MCYDLCTGMYQKKNILLWRNLNCKRVSHLCTGVVQTSRPCGISHFLRMNALYKFHVGHCWDSNESVFKFIFLVKCLLKRIGIPREWGLKEPGYQHPQWWPSLPRIFRVLNWMVRLNNCSNKLSIIMTNICMYIPVCIYMCVVQINIHYNDVIMSVMSSLITSLTIGWPDNGLKL